LEQCSQSITSDLNEGDDHDAYLAWLTTQLGETTDVDWTLIKAGSTGTLSLLQCEIGSDRKAWGMIYQLRA